ncbi:lipid A-modifier LpxR family protein [Hydrotalea sandarakina]|jgi:lipid A 3-O-deacylase|uniref:Outer membrane beta-barrel porin/alpha-amylase n=1 Tax=Hydrotalea sandarakina TaxID=1004304 RepID=A0A2W7RVN0_9BACT|nr:lipid A-modifier LpxR family protein [Hydrotalea sandarakina]PZX62906.1 hypothetical protein LX80_01601 [Hydrotalea sandarakina]
MKIWVCLLFCCSISQIFAQKNGPANWQHSISITTDNDAYLLQDNDKYYTNGLYFQYNFSHQKQNATIVQSIEAGQALYTPRLLTFYPDSVDRPYCGYLFLTYKHLRLQQHYGLQWNVSVGTIGNNSLGQNFQNGLHHLLGLYPVTDWYKQVQVPITINAMIQYMPFIHALTQSNTAKIIPVFTANAGNVYTNAKAGAFFVLGKLNANTNSALWNVPAYNPSKSHQSLEWFVYFYPEITLQGYNATVQGSSSNTSSTVAGTPEKWMYQQNWGIVLAQGHWMGKIEIVYQTKECITQYLPQRYASIQLTYCF